MTVKPSLNSGTPAGGQSLSIIWIVAAALGIIFGGLLIGTLSPSLFPEQASLEAEQVDGLFQFMLVIGGAIFLLVIGVLVFSMVRFRARINDRSDGIPLHGNSTLELIWTLVPAVIVLVVTIYSYQVWISIRTVQPINHDVQAIGARYAWTFNYDITPETLPAGITIDQITEEPIRVALNSESGLDFNSGQLHTWAGEQVEMSMRPEDVNHAFWIPAMRIKQDLLVGRTTSITFTPTDPGTYRIVCAELCGSGHGNMAGTIGYDGELQGAWLVVHPDEETYLREFYEPQVMSVLFPPPDPALRGRATLASAKYPCATCHILDDLGWAGAIGPNLNNVGNNAARRASGTPAEVYLETSIRHPGDYLVPGYGNLMPQFNDETSEPNYMPEEDLTNIIAYLLTQKQ
ncbi:MAG: cytochrome c oxidase subunit II [Chloroflexota bacterium]|nr:cytochrome c oxidase subunit II [Chloroflexota bacterium]